MAAVRKRVSWTRKISGRAGSPAGMPSEPCPAPLSDDPRHHRKDLQLTPHRRWPPTHRAQQMWSTGPAPCPRPLRRRSGQKPRPVSASPSRPEPQAPVQGAPPLPTPWVTSRDQPQAHVRVGVPVSCIALPVVDGEVHDRPFLPGGRLYHDSADVTSIREMSEKIR